MCFPNDYRYQMQRVGRGVNHVCLAQTLPRHPNANRARANAGKSFDLLTTGSLLKISCVKLGRIYDFYIGKNLTLLPIKTLISLNNCSTTIVIWLAEP